MASLVDAVLGDHALALSQRDGVPAYEETHAEVQNVLLPPGVPRGLSFQVLQSVNKHVALTHRRVALTALSPARCEVARSTRRHARVRESRRVSPLRRGASV